MLKASRVGFEVASRQAELPTADAIRQQFADRGQGHVFRFWDALDARGRERLIQQAASIDLPALLEAYAALGGPQRQPPKLEPVEVEAVPESGGDPQRWTQARARGEALLAEGRVAVMVVAGGQATRLGIEGPKGGFPLGPVTGRSLFGQQAQQIRRLRARCGQPVPWYVMTSPATDAATRACFAKADHFGLPPGDIIFLRQAMVPSFDFAGKLMLTAPDRISENPDGHGGSLTALRDSGALDDMARRGADTIFYYQVDNPLVDIGAAAFLGFHAQAGAEVSCKVMRKREPGEKVGVLARVDGRVGVVEYTEIDDAQRNAREPSGELRYWAGNIAVHVFDCDLVRRVAEQAERWLPLHRSKKKIAAIDADGGPLQPEEPNGYKLERFVFDALAATDRVCVVETLRRDEYSPVKNAEGGESPETARRDLVNRYRTWLEGAGIELPRPGVAIEIDESRIGGSEDARALGIRRIEEAGDVIHVADGDEA
jgi:UDP-N-acetylglucosamine/UDP-N-acetylgalactosamine diphosphorylase